MLSVGVQAMAALVGAGEAAACLGRIAPVDAVPKGLRRKLSSFDLGVARCVIGLTDPARLTEIVFASRFGAMEVTMNLLDALGARELLSPAKFSASVHNAAVGYATQMTGNRRAHTAIAAGLDTLAAGLTESWTRLRAGEERVMLIYADEPLPDIYAGHDEAGGAPAVWLGFILTNPSGVDAGGIEVAPGRAGAALLARSDDLTGRRLAWTP
jgi:hypothetical protein